MKYQRLVRYLVLLLVLAGGLIFYLQRSAVLEQARRVLAQQLSELIGERVSFEDIELELATLSLKATGVRIDSYDPAESSPLVEIASLSVRLDAFSSPNQIRLRSIRVVRPVIRVELQDGKLLHFSGIQELLDEPSSDEKGMRLDIDALTVEDGVVAITDLGAGWSVSVGGLEASLALADGKPTLVAVQVGRSAFARGEQQASVDAFRATADLSSTPARLQDLDLKVPGGEVNAQGTFRLDEPPPGTARADLLVKADIDLNILKVFVPGLPHLEGQVALAGAVSYADAVHAEGNLQFQRLVVDEFRIGEGGLDFDATPERIEAENIVLPRGKGRVRASGALGLQDRLSLKVNADLENVQLADLLEDLSLKDPWVMMNVSGHAQVEGFLERPFKLTGNVDLEADSFGVWGESFHRATPESRIMGLASGHVSSGLEIDTNAVTLRGGVIQTPESRLFIDGAIGLNETLDLSFDAVDLNVAEISPLAGFEMAGKGWGKGRVAGPFSSLVVTMDASLFGARFDAYALGDLEGRFVAPLNSSGYLERLSNRVQGVQDGEAAVDTDGMRRLEAALRTVDERYYAGTMAGVSPPVLLMPELRTRMGRTRVVGSGALVFQDPISVYADLTLPPGSDGRPPEGRLADVLAIPGVVLEGTPLDGAVSGHVEAMGSPVALDGQGEAELSAAELYGQLVSTASGRFRLEKGDLVVESLVADTRSGELTATGTIGREGQLQATGQLEHLSFDDIAALTGSGVGGTADALLTVDGSFDAPALQGQVTLRGMSYGGKPLGDTVLTLSTAESVLKIQGIVLGEHGSLDAKIGLERSLPYDASLVLSAMPLSPYLAASEDAAVTEVQIGGTARARGDLNGDTPLELGMQVEQLAIKHGALTLENASPMALELHDGRFNIGQTRLVGRGTDLTIGGQVAPSGAVDLDLNGRFNLALLEALIPGVFQRIEGELTLFAADGSNRAGGFHIGGTLSALQFEGVATVREGAIRTIFFPPTIDQVSASISVGNNNEIRITSLTGALGGGTIEGGGVLVLGPDYYPVHYDLHLDGRDAFVHYPSFLPTGLMDASLKFNGDVGNLLMSGDVWLQRMVYRERYNWEKILTDFRTYRLESVEAVDTEPYFNIDIRIHAPGTFFIRNNIGNVQLKGELQLVGDTNVMQLRGEVQSVRGTLTILDNTFELTDAQIEFTGDYWNPAIDLKMQTEIQSYTIYYEVTGSLQDWKLNPGSDAGLSERDINSLIAFGTLADNITEGEARAVAAPTLEFLVGRFGAGLLEPLQAFARLDRFTIVPAPDQAGNMGVRFYGEKELIQNKVLATGFYDYALNGNQEFLTDLELRAFDCCSVILRLESDRLETAAPINPGLRLKLKLEFE